MPQSPMLLGVLMLALTGTLWAFTGIILSYTARQRLSMPTVMGTQLGLSLLAGAFVPNYRLLGAGLPPGTGMLVLLLVVSGVLNAVGLLSLQRAMRTGHNGIAWAIGQSALVVPFLVGVTCFGEPLPLRRILGIVAILASLGLFGLARDKTTGATAPSERWLLPALGALCLFGIQQTLMTLPSHLAGLTDAVGLRVPLLYLGNFSVYLFLWSRKPEIPKRPMLLLAGIGAGIGIISSLLLFRGLDLLAQAQMASVGFPIVVSACILAFALYSALALREPFTRRHLAGMALGLTGVVLVALNG